MISVQLIRPSAPGKQAVDLIDVLADGRLPRLKCPTFAVEQTGAIALRLIKYRLVDPVATATHLLNLSVL